MKNKWSVPFALCAMVVVMGDACRHGICRSGSPSTHGATRSHNMGRNCENCHRADGEADQCWFVGGTAYDSLSGATVADVTLRLYAVPQDSGQAKLTLDGDSKGNFYTSDDPGLAGGLYPTVTTSGGHTSRMVEPIFSGACNSCHGVTTAHIKVH